LATSPAHYGELALSGCTDYGEDLWGLRAAVWAAAAITVASGLLVAARMYETHPHERHATLL
jgi:hypothetical protein